MVYLRKPHNKNINYNQGWGENPHIYVRWGIKGHNGIDYPIPYGTEVVASADGKVVYVEYDEKGYGKYIIIQHSNGYETLYAHLSQVLANIGDTVSSGQTIALSGNTGFTLPPASKDKPYAGSHLHWGLRRVDATGKVLDRDNNYYGYLNPLLYMSDRIFPDVEDNHPYIEAIKWAKQKNIVSGYENDGYLRPDETLTVGRLLAILQKYSLSTSNSDGANMSEPSKS